MPKVRIGQGRSFSIYNRLLLTVVMIGAIIFLLDSGSGETDFYFLTVIFLSAFVPAIWTARRILEIDLKQMTIHPYLWVMGFKFGKEKKLNGAKEILIKNGESRRDRKYKVYLVSNDKNLFLLSTNKEELLKKKVDVVEKKLKIPVKDLSTRE